MPARLLDGTAIARDIREGLRPAIRAFTERVGRPPGLGIVLVGNDPASEIYVRTKLKAGSEVGLRADLHRLPASATFLEVLELVDRLNRNDQDDGILVQSPLPPALGPRAARAVFDAIDPAKDVDGFNATNVGLLAQNRAVLAPCTPSGIIEMLDRSGLEIAGRRAVVLGRSDIVGKPMSMLLLHHDATVTIGHSRTRDLAEVTRTADILVVAIGRPALVRGEFVKPGATVIDVGMNRLDDRAAVWSMFPEGSPRREQFERRGSIVIGDVHPEVAERAGVLTPVPGGVGPLTVAMLLRNTLLAAEARERQTVGLGAARLPFGE